MHSSGGLGRAGGAISDVFMINEAGLVEQMRAMQYRRIGFPVASLKNETTVVAVSGYTLW